MKLNWARVTSILSALALCLGLAGTASADRKSELQASFKERLAQIDQLKRDGTVGETWDGWVEAVNDAKLTEKQEKLVKAENADRKELYQLIADEEKTTADLVGERNAQRNYKNGRKGEWFKLKNGKWRQKERE